MQHGTRTAAALLGAAMVLLAPAPAFAGGAGEQGGEQQRGERSEQAAQERGDGAGEHGGDTGDGATATLSSSAFGTVEFLQGEVSIDQEPAEIGDAVRSGQTVVTGPEGRAEIAFGQRNIFEIRPETRVTLELGTNDVRRAEVDRGALAAVFDRLRQLTGGESAFRFQLPSAAGGVRGTVFFIKAESDTRSYVCTCNGATALRTPEQAGNGNGDGSGGDGNGPGPGRVEAGHHEAYRFIESDGAYRVEQARMRYHDDAAMDRLAEKIDVSIPWSD